MNREPPQAELMTRRRTLAGMCLGGMVTAAAGAHWLKPTERLADQLGPIRLAESIPTRFGAWRQDSQHASGIVNPQQTEQLAKLYSETVSRVYVNDDGYRIMLSIAYGGDQSDSFQLHYPDVCYPAQGFEIISRYIDELSLNIGIIRIYRLLTRLGASRPEPVSYWTMVGEKQAGMGITKKQVEMSYTLRGVVPDGLLFRISSIDPNNRSAFRMHDEFVLSLLPTLSSGFRSRLSGFR